MLGTVLITGGRGQDGWYLGELLRSNYGIVDICRSYGQPSNPPSPTRHTLVTEISALSAVHRLIREYRPFAVVHLAAVHGPSGAMPGITSEPDMFNVHVRATHNFLEAIRRFSPETRFIGAATSKMYDGLLLQDAPSATVPLIPSAADTVAAPCIFVNESTPFAPVGAYAHTKAAGAELVRAYRDSASLHAQTVILFNHESPRRPTGYLFPQLATQLAGILRGAPPTIHVRDASHRADWSDARDLMTAVSLALHHTQPRDYVLGSGTSLAVEDLIHQTGALLGLPPLTVTSTAPAPNPTSALIADTRDASQILSWSGTRPAHQTLAEITLQQPPAGTTSANNL
ncbi:MAG: GDP-mannose 4,6-dehydratase [Chloroflexi bacterium]|nr:GDP-mannose 4,6-dehydratase [Chloroflexota bacterium]